MRGRRRLRRTSQATYAAASSCAGHVRATRFSSPRRPTAPVPPQALRAAQAVAAATIGSIFLAVTTVLLPVRAGEDYSGSGRLGASRAAFFLTVRRRVTSFGTVEILALPTLPY